MENSNVRWNSHISSSANLGLYNPRLRLEKKAKRKHHIPSCNRPGQREKREIEKGIIQTHKRHRLRTWWHCKRKKKTVKNQKWNFVILSIKFLIKLSFPATQMFVILLPNFLNIKLILNGQSRKGKSIIARHEDIKESTIGNQKAINRIVILG